MLPAYDIDTAPETTATDDLGADDTYQTWCDEHRDAWIADLDATNDR